MTSLQAQIANSGLTVEVDAPKSQDLSKIMADIRAQYDALAQKNLEDLEKYWGQQVSRSSYGLFQEQMSYAFSSNVFQSTHEEKMAAHILNTVEKQPKSKCVIIVKDWDPHEVIPKIVCPNIVCPFTFPLDQWEHSHHHREQ